MYSLELVQTICDRLSKGDLAINICAEPGMPHMGTLHRWRGEKPEFDEMYARARVMQAQACAEMAVMSGRKATAEDAAAARVRFDADRWLAARIDPKNWADRTHQTVTGPNDGPIQIEDTRVPIADLLRTALKKPE